MPDPNNIILPEHGLAFIGVCKNANTSIKRAFLESMGKWEPGINPHHPKHFQYASLEEVRDAGCQEMCISIAVVRNPFERLVSTWKDKVRGECDGKMHNWYKRHGMTLDTTFAEFVEIITQVPHEEAEQHFRPQYLETHLNRRCEVDVILRHEDLEKNWAVVQELSLVELPDLVHERATGTSHAAWSEHYTDDLMDKVAAYYAKDIKEFGYVR